MQAHLEFCAHGSDRNPRSNPTGDPVPIPRFYMHSAYAQFAMKSGDPDASDYVNLHQVAGSTGSYNDFVAWCQTLGIGPQYHKDLWTAFDAADGQQDGLLQPASIEEYQTLYEQSECATEAINKIVDPDNNGVMDPREYAVLCGQTPLPPLRLDQDHDGSTYLTGDLNADGEVDALDQEIWDDQWAHAHNGVSFYSEPENATIRAQAIAKKIVAAGKTFNLFGEVHTHHPWQEIQETICTLRAAGKPVIYTVELDPLYELHAADQYAQTLFANSAALQDPVRFRAAVEQMASLIDRMESKDIAYSVVSAIRNGAQVAFVDVTPPQDENGHTIADAREIDPNTGQRRTRDEMITRNLLALQTAHPDAVFVCQLGSYHASAHDLPDSGAPGRNNISLRPVARRLLDTNPNDVLAMSFTPVRHPQSVKGVTDRIYDLEFTVPWSGGFCRTDSWAAEGWLKE